MWSSQITEDTPISEYALKRIFDFSLALFGCILFLPVAVVIALAIVLEDWGPVFYTQKRVGKDNRVFDFYKFRTMRADADQLPPPPNPEEDYRVTKVGWFLRKTALNELPQLLNILKGDMSFVGPRPEMPHLAEKIAQELPRYPLRHKVRPGLTGLAQLYCRKDTAEHQKLRFDLLYLERQSLCLDIWLILRSIPRTLLGKWDP